MEVKGRAHVTSPSATPKKSIGVVIVLQKSTGQTHIGPAHCLRTIFNLVTALHGKSITTKIGVVAHSSKQLGEIGKLLERNEKFSVEKVLEMGFDPSLTFSEVALKLSASHVLIVNDSVSLSEEFIDSFVKKFALGESVDGYFPEFYVKYGSEFIANNYEVVTSHSELAAVSPFTELLPSAGIVSSDLVLSVIKEMDQQGLGDFLSCYYYLMQQRLLRYSLSKSYVTLSGCAFEVSVAAGQGRAETNWDRRVGLSIRKLNHNERASTHDLSWILNQSSDFFMNSLRADLVDDKDKQQSLLSMMQNFGSIDPLLMTGMPTALNINHKIPNRSLGGIADAICVANPSRVVLIGINPYRLERDNGVNFLMSCISKIQLKPNNIGIILSEDLTNQMISRITDNIFVVNCRYFDKNSNLREDLRSFLLWVISRYDSTVLNLGCRFLDDFYSEVNSELDSADRFTRTRYFPSSKLLPGSVSQDHSGSASSDQSALRLLHEGLYGQFTSTHNKRRHKFFDQLSRFGNWVEPPFEINSEAKTLLWLLDQIKL